MSALGALCRGDFLLGAGYIVDCLLLGEGIKNVPLDQKDRIQAHLQGGQLKHI